MTDPVSAEVISRLKSVLGEGGWSQDPVKLAPKLVEERGRWKGTTPLLVLPRTVDEVAAVIGVCFDSGTAIVPQGGNTGLVAGQTPQGEILLSLERMKAVREVAHGPETQHRRAAGIGRDQPAHGARAFRR